MANASGLVSTCIKPTLRYAKDKYFAGTVNMQIAYLHMPSGPLN